MVISTKIGLDKNVTFPKDNTGWTLVTVSAAMKNLALIGECLAKTRNEI
jgi:hypothetical protein